MENLKRYRQFRGYSRQDFAKMSGITTETLARYERGDRFPRGNMILKFAELLNTTTDELLKAAPTGRRQRTWQGLRPLGSSKVNNAFKERGRKTAGAAQGSPQGLTHERAENVFKR